MTRVGILSDTHGRLSLAALGCLVECDHIIHAGDIGNPDILTELQEYAPVTAVLGNNDYSQDYNGAVRRFDQAVIDGVTFFVGHFPRDVRPEVVVRYAHGQDVLAENGARGAQVCVHGHIHYPVLLRGNQAAPAQLVVCPGSVSFPRMGFPASVAYVEVCDGTVTDAWIESLDGKRLM